MTVQPPTRADAFQVENADSLPGPRLIEARIEDGSLFFTDPKIPLGIALFQLGGLQRAHNTIVVSQTGEAASKDPDHNPVTTIQKALDLIPDSADVNNPWSIIVMPGVYDENILWVKDHVYLQGLGPVTIRSPLNQSTIRIVEGPFTIPRKLQIKNIRIENTFNNRACIDFITSQFATGTVTLAANPNVGDSLTFGGQLFTAVANGSVLAANQFELGITPTDTVLNLVTAISDPINGLVGQVYPSGSLNVLTLRAFEPGILGNTITMVSSVPLVMVLSGATFSGGLDSSNGSTVAFYGAEILDCNLAPTGMNAYQIRAQAVNNIKVRGGDWTDSAATITFLDIRDVASFDIQDVTAQRVELHYDSAAVNKPFILTSSYSCQNLEVQSQFSSDLDGVGSLLVEYGTLENVTISGTQTYTFRYCRVQDVLVGDTANVILSHCQRGTLGGVGTAFVSETEMFGSISFLLPSVSQTFTFDVPNPDANYQVIPEITSSNVPFVNNKTGTNFTIDFPVPFSGSVNVVVKRNV